MATDDWYPDWIAAHTGRFPRGDWPDSGAEFWDTLRHVFVTKGVTREVADAASKLLFEDPPQFATDHPKALLVKIREVWKTAPAEVAAFNDRDSAYRASRDCDDCRGDGLTLRWRWRSLGTVDSQGRPHLPFVMLYCTCPMGRFAEKVHRAKAPEIRKRIYDLADYPWLRGHEYRRPHDGPPPEPPATTQPDAWY